MPPQSGAPGFSVSLRFSLPHTHFIAPFLLTPLPSAHTHYFLAPSMPKMPPAVRKCQTFTTHHPPHQICTLSQTHTAQEHTVHACTHGNTLACTHPPLTHNKTEQISLVRGWMPLMFASLWSWWWDVVWRMLENPQQHHGLSRLHF